MISLFIMLSYDIFSHDREDLLEEMAQPSVSKAGATSSWDVSGDSDEEQLGEARVEIEQGENGVEGFAIPRHRSTFSDEFHIGGERSTQAQGEVQRAPCFSTPGSFWEVPEPSAGSKELQRDGETGPKSGNSLKNGKI